MTKPKPTPTKPTDPARHLHHARSAMPKPGEMLTTTNTLHSIKATPKAPKAIQAISQQKDNWASSALQRRRQAERVAVHPDKAPITNATSRAPLVAPRPASLRPGAEDYRQHPSLVADKRVTYAARCGS